MNKKYETKSIVEAALISVIIFLLMFMSSYVPLIASFVMPIPIAMLYLRHDKSVAILSIIVSGVLVAMFNNIFIGILSAIIYGVTGITLGICIKKKIKPIKTIFILGVVNLITTILNLYVTVYIISGENISIIIQQIIDMMKESLEVYSSIGIDIRANPLYQIINNLTIESVMVIIPSGFIISAILSAFFNYIISRSIFKKFKYELEPLPSFENWYLDARLGAIFIIIVCLSAMASSKELPYAKYIFTTVYNLLNFSVIIVGLSVIVYFLKNKLKMSKVPLIIIGILIVTSPIGGFLTILGFIDLIVDIRGVDPESLGNAIRRKMS